MNWTWFVDNPMGSFYRSDTVKITALLNYNCDEKSVDGQFGMMYFNNSEEILTLDFIKNKKLNTGEQSFRLCGISSWIGNGVWNFDENSEILEITLTEELNNYNCAMRFKILGREEKNLKWADKDNEQQFSAYAVTLNLVRLD